MSEHGAFGNVAPSIRHCGLSAARTTHPLLIGQSAAPGGARGTAAQLRVAEVSANTAYLSHGNLETVVRAGGMPNIPKLDGNQAKIFSGFTKALGMPGMGASVNRGMNSDTTLAGPWDAGTLVNGSWLIVTKDDVELTMILGTADYDKAKALLAAACEKL